MKNLEDGVDLFDALLARAEKQRADLLRLQSWGVEIVDNSGKDIVPDRIAQEDAAVLAYQKALVAAQSILGRAQSGEDV